MSFFSTHRPRAVERGLARGHERRSPQAGASLSYAPTTASSEASSSPAPGPQVFTKPSSSIKALAAVITVLGLIVMGIAIWRCLAWRRRRHGAPSNSAKRSAYVEESKRDLEASVQEPGRAVLFPAVPPASSGVNWTPQIKPAVRVEYSRKVSYELSDDGSEEMTEKSGSSIFTGHDRSPPPSYGVADGNKVAASFMRSYPAPPAPPPETKLPPTPPTPPASLRLKVVPGYDSFLALVPSPRSSSFAHQQSSAKSTSTPSRSSGSSKKLPRLMTVVTTFEASKEDELAIKTDEVLRLLEEYEDEWCMVQRVGRYDAEKGVIPRFCLVERPDVVKPYAHKRSLLSTSSFSS